MNIKIKLESVKKFFSNKNIVIIAFVLIVISTLLSFNLYLNSSKDNTGKSLGCANTFRNIFGVLPVLNTAADAVIDTAEPIVTPIVKPIVNNFKEIKNKVKIVKKKKKEVFNIDLNDFSYEEAPMVCKALGAKIATYDQVIEAHKKGAHWCNYGWSANQMALYPTQENIWKKLQEGDEDMRNICGKPGVNGGHFENKELKFGVNCYGTKPQPDPSKIVYNSNKENIDEIMNPKRLDLLNKFKKMAAEGKLDVRPFSNNKWSNYSFKNSSYIINPSYTQNLEEQEVPIIITQEIEEEEKNPNRYESSAVITENIDDEPLHDPSEVPIDNPTNSLGTNENIGENENISEDVI